MGAFIVNYSHNLSYGNKLATEQLKLNIKNEGMLFCKEDSVAGYLGVHVDCHKDSTIHLTEKGRTHQIVKAMHLTDSTVDPIDTPCAKYLPIDEFGCLAHDEFSYPSVVGQPNYLQGHSRSDITVAT